MILLKCFADFLSISAI